jgi:hypothetical protein
MMMILIISGAVVFVLPIIVIVIYHFMYGKRKYLETLIIAEDKLIIAIHKINKKGHDETKNH